MRHENSVLHGLLQFVPWGEFDRLVEEHGADDRSRKFSARSHLVALLSGQVWGCESLRAIETLQAANVTRLYHVGARPVRRSTLADANAARPWAVFHGLFEAVLRQAQPGLRRKAKEAIRLIDATCLPLMPLYKDAVASPSVRGPKLHVIYDPSAETPVYFELSAGNVNDICMAREMPIEAGTTYVFDRAYYDFAWWAYLIALECRFVTRLKRHSPTTVVAERDVAPGSAVVSDCIVRLNGRLSSTRRNPIDCDLREIHLTTDDGKALRLITNDLSAPAEEIADLYKQRWQIELFFRWVKQNLKIRKFLGSSENAVRIQIAAALITFILLRLAFRAQSAVRDLLAFVRLVRIHLHHRRNILALNKHETPPQALHTAQFVLCLT
jgi:Transposase DDE domain/Domain of unknown function (DUF4372)